MRNLFIIAIVLLFPGIVAAQSSSLFPSSSGSSSSGSGGTSGSSGGGSAASGIQQSLSGGGSGGGGGSGATFGTGELGGPEFTQFGQAGEAAMNQEFVGVGQSGTFVGVEQTATGQESMQNRQGLQGLGNRGEGQSQGRSTTSSSRSRAERLRPVTRIAFNYEVVSPTVVQTRIDTQLAEHQFDVAGLSYSLDGDGVLTLSGVASSLDASRLAETYLGFEPGVRRVDNQIVVNQ